MSLPSPDLDRRFSREEFRQWCAAQTTGRYERVDGRIVAMAPERGAHLRVKGAVYKALDRAIAAAGVFCQALPDGAAVETGDSDYEPDALVNCGEPMADDAIAAPNPVIDRYLTARVPRVRCDKCGIHTVSVPWARPDSGFTRLFEAMVMTMVSAMPVAAVARMVGEHDTRLWRVVHHYVDAARARLDASDVTRVAIDETAAQRGHKAPRSMLCQRAISSRHELTRSGSHSRNSTISLPLRPPPTTSSDGTSGQPTADSIR